MSLFARRCAPAAEAEEREQREKREQELEAFVARRRELGEGVAVDFDESWDIIKVRALAASAFAFAAALLAAPLASSAAPAR